MMKRIAGIVIVVAAVALAAGAWLVTLRAAPATGPERMTWHKADGSVIVPAAKDAYPFDGCTGDIGMTLGVWNGGVIIPCDHEATGVGWAFLDPRTHEATLRWPLAPGATRGRTQGLIVGPDHQLAIVFNARLQGDVWVGIAGPQGWVRAPENLGRLRYHAAAWVGGKLELAVRQTSDASEADKFGMSAAIEVITLDGAAHRSRIALPSCGTDCVMPEIVYRAGDHWVFEHDGRAVGEGGAPAVVAFKDQPFESMIDLAAQGKVDTPAELALGEDTLGIAADGKPTHAAAPPRSGLRVVSQTRFTLDGAIRRRPQWVVGEDFHLIVEQVGDRTITWHTGDDDRVRFTDAAIGPGGVPPVAPVARWYKGLAIRVAVADDAGGFWMIDGTGEHIHLDAALHRLDPLGLRTHLRQRGSLGIHIDEPEHEKALGWALFGLPLLVAGFGLAAWLTKAARGRAVVVAAALYLATGGWALLHVLPLLA
jgi:hypothetical protein